MARLRGSKSFRKYRVVTLPVAITDHSLEQVLKAQAAQRYELCQMILSLGIGLRLVFTKRGND